MAKACVVRTAAVTQGYVEVPVRSEGDCATVVVHIGFIDLKNYPLGAHVDLVRVLLGHGELRNMVGAIEPLGRSGP